MDSSHQNDEHSGEELTTSDPLGIFHRLPTEVTEQILSYLPASSLADLASLSQSWHTKVKQQFSTKQAMLSVISSTRVPIVNGALVYDAAKFKDLARLVRLITLFQGGFSVRLRWLRTIMQQIRVLWTAPSNTLRAFNSFLKVCFISCTEEEFDQVIKAVNSKLRMSAYVETILAHGRRGNYTKEQRLASVTNLIFGKRFEKEITKFLTRGRPNTDIAHIAFTLQMYNRESTNVPYSASWWCVWQALPKATQFTNIAEILNWPFWAEDPYNIDAILVALLDHNPKWHPGSTAALFVHLSPKISTRYLLRVGIDKAAKILMHVGKHLLDALETLKAHLRETSKETYTDLMKVMKFNVKREILKPPSCGSCQYCDQCQRKKLFAMLESYDKQP